MDIDLTCMHWYVTYERTLESVTRVCTDCGARGSVPRCQSLVKKTGEQCELHDGH